MNRTSESTNIDEYIEAASSAAQPILREIRGVVRAAVPQATETVSYGMPAFKSKRVFFYFAAFKNHIGVYPPVNEDSDLRGELAPYANEKGNLRFPLTEPVPYALIARVAAALAIQYGR